MTASPATSKPQVPAARNTLRILALLSTIDVPVSAARIRAELELPRSSTYHLLNEMVDAGFVVYLPETKTYGLGLAAYSMAAAYSTQQPLVRLADKYLKSVAEDLSGSAHLSRLVGQEIVYLQEIRATGAPSLITEVGVHLPALQTASGRVLLAHLPSVQARATFDGMSPLVRELYNGSPLTYGEFATVMGTIREAGWAEEVESVSRGQASVAVPVFDHLERPAAALAVTARVDAMGSETIAGVAKQLGDIASVISDKMYGRGRA
ncbi:IclR family transcriptional regulator [Corynebacterium incognita]|uniref:IclR family transcriptional regulator n=1 Tax=Corynebacterium incognita TaxID=2754725 RepID=A0A7G7CP28_9CORY|nr:IclR family transcriptional regulator [Corynebacterium incognita]QNE89344.1 IclR family transcriptional regulator [Corynebacterium incognita]